MRVNFLNRNTEGWQPSGPSGGDRQFAACALRAAGVRVAVTSCLPPPRESILSGRVPAQDGPAFLPCHRGEIGPWRVCAALSHSPGVVSPALPANVPETCRITSWDIEPWSLRCGPCNPAQKTDGGSEKHRQRKGDTDRLLGSPLARLCQCHRQRRVPLLVPRYPSRPQRPTCACGLKATDFPRHTASL